MLGRRTSPAKSWDVKSPVFTPNNRDTHDAKTRYSSLHSQRKKSDVRSSLPRSLFLVPPPAAEGFSRHGSHRCCGKAGGGMRLQRTGSVGPTGVTSDSTDCRRARWRSSTVALRRVEVPFRGAKGDNQSAMGPVSLEQPRLFGDGVDNNSLSEWLRTALPSDSAVYSSPHGHSTCLPICTLDKFHRKHDTPEKGAGVAAMFSLIQATCHALPELSNLPSCDFKVAMQHAFPGRILRF